ncbi:MAG TPA: undecaprenyldiphospho-muramoylpentapeptide beta-N-acetylglucosaminyltransferase [Acidobacteriota bacterium]|jgi:UDP-N-acetylglucosamine--N-acetylmuramyl-(pentapeptide) pyrophosphoryl-undecaprenol N-acetylglucosamine transferase
MEWKRPLRLLIAGGGTGGHIFMGISLAEEWKKRGEKNEVLFVGARGRLEETLVPRAGIRLELLKVFQLKGLPAAQRAKNFFKLPGPLFRCMQINRSYRPDVAIGVGGYSSGPAILAASLQRIPTIIVEPNAKPGITNRWLCPWIRLAAVAFPEAEQYFGRKTRLTGIPVRKEFFYRAEPAPVLRLLIFGGSQGSRAINAAAAQAVPLLKAEISDLRVVHQTGPGEFELYRKYQTSWWKVVPFIEDMAGEMSSATVVVCRAGASTLAELAAAGKCSLLIPFPFAADDHQTVNARSLAKRGSARLLPQSELDGQSLFRSLLELFRDPEQRSRMETAVRQFSNPKSAQKIIDMALDSIDGIES